MGRSGTGCLSGSYEAVIEMPLPTRPPALCYGSVMYVLGRPLGAEGGGIRGRERGKYGMEERARGGGTCSAGRKYRRSHRRLMVLQCWVRDAL